MEETMRYMMLAMIATVALLVRSCTMQMSETVQDKNAGMNGGFEYVEKGLPVNWLLYTQKTMGKGDFEISLDSRDFKEGLQSLKFTVRECSDQGDRFSPGLAQEFPANPGETYRISFWAKNQGSEFKVNIRGVNARNRDEGLIIQQTETIDTWRLFEYNYRIPENMSKLRFELNVLQPGVFWIDDIRITKTADMAQMGLDL
jgi:hypothetical protein